MATVEPRRPGARTKVVVRPPSPRDDTPVYINGRPAEEETDPEPEEDPPESPPAPAPARSAARTSAPSAARTSAPSAARTPAARTLPPRTLVHTMQHKMFRPNQLPAWEFYNGATAFAHLSDRDYYTAAETYRTRAAAIHRGCPKLIPPEILDTDSPSMGKHKFDLYYKQAAALKSAAQVGNLLFLGIRALEWFLTTNKWFKVPAQGLYTLQVANMEEYYNAIIDLGQRSLGWIRGNMGPVLRMCIMFGVSMFVLIATNYLIQYMVPDAVRPMANSLRDKAVHELQNMASMLLGIKEVDPEKPDEGMGGTVLGMAMNMFGGAPAAPPHVHDE